MTFLNYIYQMNKLNISRFKCFVSEDFELNKVTLLTGSNGTGKSSLIQALLLCRIAIEKRILGNKDQLEINNIEVPLNKSYQLGLGEIYDVIRDTKTESGFKIQIDNHTFLFDSKEESDITLKCNYKSTKSSISDFLLKEDFYYLHAERLGPRQFLESSTLPYIHCGHRGEFVSLVLNQVETTIGFKSAMIENPTLKFENEVNKWLNIVCPGISIGNKKLSSTLTQVKIKGSASKSDLLATNIGFGVSYVLPIIVTGLIAQKDTMFIVENPEAHLHPKGQSNIGYFLGKVAQAGVKLIIETHSEHVVNGIRRAALDSDNFKSKDVNIYFFGGFDENKLIQKILIKINKDGNLTDFPEDFFDQTRQDLLEIIKLSKKI